MEKKHAVKTVKPLVVRLQFANLVAVTLPDLSNLWDRYIVCKFLNCKSEAQMENAFVQNRYLLLLLVYYQVIGSIEAALNC